MLCLILDPKVAVQTPCFCAHSNILVLNATNQHLAWTYSWEWWVDRNWWTAQHIYRQWTTHVSTSYLDYTYNQNVWIHTSNVAVVACSFSVSTVVWVSSSMIRRSASAFLVCKSSSSPSTCTSRVPWPRGPGRFRTKVINSRIWKTSLVQSNHANDWLLGQILRPSRQRICANQHYVSSSDFAFKTKHETLWILWI